MVIYLTAEYPFLDWALEIEVQSKHQILCRDFLNVGNKWGRIGEYRQELYHKTYGMTKKPEKDPGQKDTRQSLQDQDKKEEIQDRNGTEEEFYYGHKCDKCSNVHTSTLNLTLHLTSEHTALQPTFSDL